MAEQQLKITLLDSAIFTANSATEGGLRTLGYIPGAALLGVAAARCYENCGDAWNLFHSGAVRFGDGVPLHHSGDVAWPAPLTWQRPKEGAFLNAQGQIAVALINVASPTPPTRDTQRKPLRDVNVTPAGHTVALKKRVTLKTAINPLNGRAAAGQLFLYEALCAGASFIATISWDQQQDQLAQAAINALCTGKVPLGRSGGAEFGLANVQRHSPPAGRDWPRLAASTSRTDYSIWCLSDLCLLDAQGQPCLSPAPQTLGLPEGRLCVERSYIQTRSYSPYNAHRRAHDCERQVIARGSVLTFLFDHPLTPQEIEATLAAHVGMYREAGLGAVSVNHAWQICATLRVDDRVVFAAEPSSAAKPPGQAAEKNDFIVWLNDKFNRSNREAARRDWAEKKLALVGKLISAARNVATDPQLVTEPGAAQWGQLLQIGKSHQTKKELLDAVFGQGGPVFGADRPVQGEAPPPLEQARQKARHGKNSEWFHASFEPAGTEPGTGQADAAPISAEAKPTTLGDWLLAQFMLLPEQDAGAHLAALAGLARGDRHRGGHASVKPTQEQAHGR